MSKNAKGKFNKKLLISAEIALIVMLAVSVTAFAWFTNQRKLDTITKISSPISLKIGAGAREDSANIDMGGIDVTNPAKKKDFVFCVYSDETVANYKIQLAHTTNVAFTYKIYHASESEQSQITGDFVVYVDESSNSHYYAKGTELAGGYLNRNSETGIADNTKHEITYGTYDKVQKNAEPLYWQNTGNITPTMTDGVFTDYYILEVSWGDGVSNNKETDMVYLTAGMS